MDRDRAQNHPPVADRTPAWWAPIPASTPAADARAALCMGVAASPTAHMPGPEVAPHGSTLTQGPVGPSSCSQPGSSASGVAGLVRGAVNKAVNLKIRPSARRTPFRAGASPDSSTTEVRSTVTPRASKADVSQHQSCPVTADEQPPESSPLGRIPISPGHSHRSGSSWRIPVVGALATSTTRR